MILVVILVTLLAFVAGFLSGFVAFGLLGQAQESQVDEDRSAK